MGQTGPCPSCHALLTAPIVELSPPLPPPVAPSEMPPVSTTDPGRPKGPGLPVKSRRKGVVLPDSNIDRRELERREMWVTLRVLMLLIVVVTACVSILWYMKHWVAK